MTDVPAPRGPLDDVLAAGATVHAALEAGVRRLRLEGATWAVIGDALGVTRQAAAKRWRYLDEEPPEIVVVDGRAYFHCPRTDVLADPRDPSGVKLGAAQLRELVAGSGSVSS